jgi:hypothetical protein
VLDLGLTVSSLTSLALRLQLGDALGPDGCIHVHSEAFLSHVFGGGCPNSHLLPRTAPPAAAAAGGRGTRAARAAEAAAADDDKKYGALRDEVRAEFCHCKLCRTRIGEAWPVPDCTAGQGEVPCHHCITEHPSEEA